jgi:hypothetical protein
LDDDIHAEEGFRTASLRPLRTIMAILPSMQPKGRLNFVLAITIPSRAPLSLLDGNQPPATENAVDNCLLCCTPPLPESPIVQAELWRSAS